MLQALQADQHLAMQTLFQVKHALNRSTHAAAQQIDLEKLAYGVVSIDEQRAYETAMLYLQANLRLDTNHMPLPDAFLRQQIEVLAFEVINEHVPFPYSYTSEAYDYQVTVHRPSVILIIRVNYPRTFNVLGPITWEIKGAAEIVNYF